jgi:hypothetical protein
MTKGVGILPTQIHHFATNKQIFTQKRMAKLLMSLGWNNETWNKQALPHFRADTANDYHKICLRGNKCKAGAGGSQVEFLNLF